MHIISKDHPAYFFTVVAKDRLPVFRTDRVKEIVCTALDEARKSGGFSIYTYVIMLDHLHLITGCERKPSETLRYVNGIISRKVIDYLKDNNFQSSLLKLRQENKGRNYRHSLWDHHSNTFLITSENVMMQRVNYIHNNPVNAGLCERPEEYRFSGARIWLGCPVESEPLELDNKKIKWREA